jgi:hypothetical protein
MEAHIFEGVHGEHADEHFVFDDENASRSRLLTCHGLLVVAWLPPWPPLASRAECTALPGAERITCGKTWKKYVITHYV